ncbi:hypothetical protein KCU81_g492, partial [Aureobasidium melanogenum]
MLPLDETVLPRVLCDSDDRPLALRNLRDPSYSIGTSNFRPLFAAHLISEPDHALATLLPVFCLLKANHLVVVPVLVSHQVLPHPYRYTGRPVNHAPAVFFLGVAFLGAAFFLLAAALVAGAEGAVLLREPELGLVQDTATQAFRHTGALFLTLETLALVLVALAGAAVFLVAAVLGAALVAAFLGAAAFLAGASFAAVFLALAAVFGAALVALVSVFLLSAFFAAGGEPAFALASLTGWKDEKKLLTLGALEDTRLATLGKSTVELVGEGGLGHAGEVVVGLDVFLESLTAVGIVSNEHINATITECKATDLLP